MLAVIPAWPGYLVSDDGRVFSTLVKKKSQGSRSGTHTVVTSEVQRELTLMVCFGYAVASLQVLSTGRSCQVRVHRLVLEAFRGAAPADKPEARHLNGNRLDNRIDNLAWGTRQENIDDRERHGTTIRGERQHNAKLTADAVREIRACPKRRGNFQALMAKYGITASTFRAARRGRTWAHVI